jgi:hypothetical protein
MEHKSLVRGDAAMDGLEPPRADRIWPAIALIRKSEDASIRYYKINDQAWRLPSLG